MPQIEKSFWVLFFKKHCLSSTVHFELQIILLLIIIGGIDPRHPVGGGRDEFLRHAFRGQAIRVVFPHQGHPAGADGLAGRFPLHAQHLVRIFLHAGGKAALSGPARGIRGQSKGLGHPRA